jgi:hypothetical protein
VTAENAAQATLLRDVVTQNAGSGIVSQSNSSVTVSLGSTSQNGLHGIDVEASSSLVVNGTYTSTGMASSASRSITAPASR